MKLNRRMTVILATLALAGIAFELFNFDTTRFALTSLFGDAAGFGGLSWAVVLAIAFCSIDCAGLLQLVAPSPTSSTERRAGHLIFGAWLLGATLNAVLTWYAVGITMLTNPLANPLITHQQLLRWFPVVMAALVWVTRILFIWGLSLIADELIDLLDVDPRQPTVRSPSRPERAYLREAEPFSAEFSPNGDLNV